MEAMDSSMTRHERQLLVGLTLVLFTATLWLSVTSREVFRPYFGGLHPVVAFALVSLTGLSALWLLRTRGWFEVFRGPEVLHGMTRAVQLASCFAAVMIAVDALFGLPRDINVPLPAALLFYPVMGFVVEMVFHAIPLLLILMVTGMFGDRLGRRTRIWTAILCTALVEPVFQVVAGAPAGGPGAVDLYVGLHVFLFTVVELHLFQRYDFTTMFGYRMVYYLWWHIAWGALRLGLLF